VARFDLKPRQLLPQRLHPAKKIPRRVLRWQAQTQSIQVSPPKKPTKKLLLPRHPARKSKRAMLRRLAHLNQVISSLKLAFAFSHSLMLN
jgi:hypothetical protein